MQWHDLLSAFALYLVLEGILPFISPLTCKRALLRICETENSALRLGGGLSMLAGISLLYLAR